MQGFFDGLGVWATFVGSFVILVGSAEFGRRRGMARNSGPSDMISAIHGAALGLLALLIGFTFSMALSRFDGRRAMVLEEANAIGTAALRAKFLPEAQAAPSLRLLRDYAAGRPVADGVSVDEVEASGFVGKAARAHDALWTLAVVASREAPLSVPVGLYVRALNDMIDLHEKRITGLRGRVPAVVFLMLHGMAALAMGIGGYNSGLQGGRHRGAVAVMAVMLAAVLMLVADIDAPQRGFISVSQQPLLDLLAGFPK
jgi:hypothetical protein